LIAFFVALCVALKSLGRLILRRVEHLLNLRAARNFELGANFSTPITRQLMNEMLITTNTNLLGASYKKVVRICWQRAHNSHFDFMLKDIKLLPLQVRSFAGDSFLIF
jgi:hypothetical protein